MIDIHEKFYGQAMREINSGAAIRHDLWAKAIALSAGDREAAQSVYLDLLARHFSEAAQKAGREEMKQTAIGIAHLAGRQGKIAGFKVLCWGIWAALSILIYIGATHWVDKLYQGFIYDYSNAIVPTQQDKPLTFTDPQGHIQTEPTHKQYYQAYVSKVTGIKFSDLPEQAIASVRDDSYSLQLTYGEEGGRLLTTGGMTARITYEAVNRDLQFNPNYPLAVKFGPLPWVFMGVICLGAWLLITRKMLKIYRRGYFQAPIWMEV